MPPRPTTPPGKSSAFSFGNEWSWSLDAITPPPTSERSKGTSLSASSHGQSPTLNAGHSGSALFRFGQSSSPLLPSFKFDPAQKPDSQAASTKSSSVQSPPVFSSLFGSPNSDVGSAAPSVPSTPQRGHKATLPVCQFGDETGFSFRGLHNASPMPSPKPQPQHETPTQWSPPPLALSSPKPNQNHDLASPVGLKPANVLHSSVGTSSAPATRSDDTDDSKPLPPTKTVQAVSGAAGVSPDVIPYDVRDEQAPPHRFFTNEFQRTLQAGIEVAKKTTEILDQPRRLMNDSALDKLHDDAKKLRVFHGSDTRTIAVLGDSGEGKSSLINSLLHFPGIAKTGDIGSACTSVVTEYRQKTADHTAPITIEVEYLSSTGIEEVVSELLWSYRQLYLPLVQSDETTAKDFEEYERKSAQAWSALEAAFKHHRQFNERFLQDQTEGAFEKIKQQLLKWTHAIQWPSGGVDGVWKATASDAAECCERTELFMGDQYWPFTKIIRVFLSSQVLKTGIILADLPGLQDTNLARVRATQDYLMKCNNIFIVAKISRAITDQSLKSSLFSVLSRHVPLEWEESGAKSLNIAVVCTKSDDINLSRAREEFSGPRKKIPSAVIDQLDKDIKAAKAAGDRPHKKELKQRRELLFIEARNDYVKEGLQRAYASKVPNRQLDVFCVSNKMYEKLSRKGNKELVVASGIPEVRRFCLRVTADAQLREARHFLQSSLFSLLNSLEMWAGSLSAETETDSLSEESCDEIFEMVAKTRVDAAAAARKLTKDFEVCFKDQIMKLSDNRYHKWQAAAVEEEQHWQGWHWTQYNAWCLHDGFHSTPKRPAEDWNAKITWKMRTELEYQWDLVEEEVADIFDELSESIETLLIDVRESLDVIPESHSLLVDGINSRIKDIKYKLELAKESFEREVKLTRRYASESNSKSYILNEMIPTYRHAGDQYGGGMAARQRSIVQGRITDGILFPNIAIAMSNRIRAILKKAKADLVKALRDIMDATETDIEFALVRQSLDQTRPIKREVDVDEILDEIKKLRTEAEALGQASGE